jgi:4-aminobutyrate aminotransferase-like enzyme/Ser/Thr protein kinase RdoA (MazF antagonist)
MPWETFAMLDTAALDRADLPRPDISAVDAGTILAETYGLTGRLTELGSQQDRNFRIEAAQGTFVLKINRAAYGTVELDAQNAAMKHLRAKGIRAPGVGRALDGREIVELSLRGEDYLVRLLEFLDGEPLTRRKHLGVKTREALGGLVASVTGGLADFRHPGLERSVQWDMQRIVQVTEHMLPQVADGDLRARIRTLLHEADLQVRQAAPRLRIHATHHDITDDNVVARPDAAGHLIPDGVIDFGDVVQGWVVADLAVCCASLLHHADGDPFYILPAVRAFHTVYPLTQDELGALWPLIVQRACLLVASGEQQLSVDPDNDYVIRNLEHEREIFRVATSVPSEVMCLAIVEAAGIRLPDIQGEFSSLLPAINATDIRLVSLDTQSDHWDRFNWLASDIDQTILRSAAIDTGYAATRYGEYRLSESKTCAASAPATHALFVDLSLPQGTRIAAPFEGEISILPDGRARLVGHEITLFLEGMDVAAEGEVSEGREIGTSGDGRVLRIWLALHPDTVPQAFCQPEHATAWRRVLIDPSPVLGFDCAAPQPGSDGILASRHAHFARPQKNYYRNPPQIERGRGEHMFDVTGRSYLDMVNNVTIAGHGHPRLVEAVSRQWARLNTNSRFHYAGVAELSARLASLAPEGLDTVFLVNSGSEAVDLALRLAWAHSGSRNIVSLLEAYHGWTVASDAVSTSIADNPRALETRPPWVHPVTAPNTYRGPFRGEDTASYYVESVAIALARIQERGESVGGFIAESVYGNAGGIPLPQGYLKEVYRLVREAGGVCIADEVQVGYGRLGHYFWGFEEQDVVPDIITIAKGMGNGHPLGAVICSRDIADSLEREGYFFSSAGGSPVSCAVGMTVLDIMEDEKLQENAREVGNYLKGRLEALGQRFPIVGAVHGMGLYLGLELVRNRETLEPATVETMAICDRLLDLGVIMQPTGDHLNVFKIKPPMCLTRESADFFADMVAKVLEEGW